MAEPEETPAVEMYDVNRAREDRLERLGKKFSFRIDQDVFHIPIELTREQSRQLRRLDDSDVDGLLKILLGDEQYERLDRYDLTVQDIAALLAAYGEASGLGLPV